MNLDYRKILFHSLGTRSKYLSQGALNNIFAAYDSAIQRGISAKQVFEQLLDTYGNGTVEQAIENYASYASALNYRLPQTPTGLTLEDALEEANKRRIILKSPSRIAEIVARYNANLHKCGATLTSSFTGGRAVSILNDEELTALEMRVPKKESEKNMCYEAWGTIKNNLHTLRNLEFE